VRRSESPFGGVLVVSFITALLGWKLIEYEETPVAFCGGKMWRAPISRRSRKERGRRDFILMECFSSMFALFS
jgi:hypothetical protein